MIQLFFKFELMDNNTYLSLAIFFGDSVEILPVEKYKSKASLVTQS